MISDKQLQILMFSYTTYDALICDGAIRSGKTSLTTVAFVDWAMRRFNEKNFAICGKTVSAAIKNIIKPYLAMSYSKKRYKMTFTHSNNSLTVSKGSRSNTFYVYGGKDESSYQLIQGITLAGAFLDEVALMPRSFVEQALARCSVDGSKLWFNCNPENPNHWFYNEWILKSKEKNALHIHFLLEDNPGLSKEKIDQYYRMYEGVFYQRYILGKWVRAEGLIYRLFANKTSDFVVDEIKDTLISVIIGIDFGASRSKTSFKATGISHNYRTVYSLMEMDIEGIRSPDEIYANFERFYLSVIQKYKKCFYIYADYGALGQIISAGLNAYMQRKGYPVQILDCSKGTILNRIELVSQLMSQGRYKITRECPKLIEALQNAMWDPKHEDVRLDDGTSDIDSLDAFEYSIFPFANNLI